jgi:7-cyano-7-deazaguanine reductase
MKHLGKQSTSFDLPMLEILDRVPAPKALFAARFICPEFSSLCPTTGQPDFAVIVIDYVPKDWLCESKSLKLYLTSFRNHKAFHEACTCMIGEMLYTLLDPYWLRVCGFFNPRGGISIDCFFERGVQSDQVFVPPPDVKLYLGR